MSFSPKQIKQLENIINSAMELLKEARTEDKQQAKTTDKKDDSKPAKPVAQRKRRSGKELIQFRKMLKSERKKGIPVAELSKKYGISATYIYQL